MGVERTHAIEATDGDTDADEDRGIERLPIDVLAHIFVFQLSFQDLGRASGVCRRWKDAVRRSLSRKHSLSFAGWKMNDESTSRLIHYTYNLKELDISRSSWGSQVSDVGLYKISYAKCIGNLTSISLWGMVGITDRGVIQLVSRASSLQHVNIGGTFITDESLYAISTSCKNLKRIVLWSCRHVTESGLLTLVNKCQKLESINVWGMRLPVSFFKTLLSISPSLQIKPTSLHLNNPGVLSIA
ncbi:F-box protein [Zostera marina]|uniref:F-box protein n=1 Tax=Zostera marina TaxID=29655 RepID=A0A0K9Q421_ZOSMR|nr:F-box protein [Zostera marina]